MATYGRKTHQVIRLSLRGCTNRPFYHIVVMNNRQSRDAKIKYQLGVYDPLPNKHNEVLVSVNFDKLRFFISNGVRVNKSVAVLLGLSGYLPIHPMTRLNAFRKQRAQAEAEAAESKQVEAT